MILSKRRSNESVFFAIVVYKFIYWIFFDNLSFPPQLFLRGSTIQIDRCPSFFLYTISLMM